MEDRDGDQLVFAAGLKMHMAEADAPAMARVIRRFGAQSVKTVAGIYWQAWKLWRKGARFHAHPGKDKQGNGENTDDGR